MLFPVIKIKEKQADGTWAERAVGTDTRDMLFIYEGAIHYMNMGTEVSTVFDGDRVQFVGIEGNIFTHPYVEMASVRDVVDMAKDVNNAQTEENLALKKMFTEYYAQARENMKKREFDGTVRLDLEGRTY